MRHYLCLLLAAATALPAAAEPLRLLTFNVRFPSKGDGANLWELRRDLLVDTVRKLDPDVMGTQELFHEQGEYIVGKIPGLAWFGLSRRGNQQDEHMGVFYRKDKWKVAESGNFWLSETPEKPGSMSWDVTLPRMVTWALFQGQGSNRRFYLLNTHFPHRREDERARVECANVIADRMKTLPADVPVVLMGDFNAPAGGEAYRLLAATLQDSWDAAAEKEGPEGTFHGFSGKPGEARIDWILFRGPWKARRASSVTVNDGGRYPSDHFPVFAELDWIN